MSTRILLDFEFANEHVCRIFFEYCQRKFYTSPAMNGKKLYLVLEKQGDKTKALDAVSDLGGQLLALAEYQNFVSLRRDTSSQRTSA